MRPKSAQARRLYALAAKLNKAAQDVETAARYMEDGARLTAEAILVDGSLAAGRRTVVSRLLSAVRYLNGAKWEGAPS